MKILIVSHEYPPVGGGGANACMNLSREYARAGHDVDIVTVWFEGEKEAEILSFDAGLGKNVGTVHLFRLKSKRKSADHCSFSEMLDYLRKAMPFADKLENEKKYDICQVFFGIPSGPIGYGLKKKYGLPYVIRFGGGDIPGFQDRFKSVYVLLGPAIKTIWKNADALVANSKGLKEFAEGFYDKKEIVVILNGVDQNAFSDNGENENKTSDHQPDTVELLFVSRLIERKGLQDFLPQLAFLRNECAQISKKIHLTVVGDGPYRSNLEAIVCNEHLGDIVSFEGQKTKTELPGYYGKADIFIFPSRKEGMPNVVLEAMSYGLPILMTPCQGSDELVNGNGYIASSDEFGKILIGMVMDDKTTFEQGLQSIQLVKSKFSWQNAAREYISIFDRLRI